MQSIRKNRTFLMGVAITLIMLCHNTIYLQWPHIAAGWGVISQIGQCGVDIFLLLSGFGLYFSYSKSPRYWPFLKRRFLRIIPKYLMIVIPYGIFLCVMGVRAIGEVVWSYSLVSFFATGTLAEWFIAAICVLYLLFPLVYVAVQKKYLWIWICAAIWTLAIFLNIFAVPYNIKVVSEIFIVRIPIFIIGAKLGQKALRGGVEDNEKFISFLKKHSGILTFLFIALFIMVRLLKQENYWVWLRLIFAPLSIVLCLFLGKVSDALNEKIVRFFSMLGTITLELYLMHEKILGVCGKICEKINVLGRTMQSIIANVLAVVIAIVVSYVFSKVYAKIFHLKT